MIGVNINCSKQDFLREILEGLKTVETRNRRTLHRFIGDRVGLIRTGCGPAVLVGYATIAGAVLYDSEESFRSAEGEHCVAAGSPYDIPTGGIKWGYILKDVKAINPTPVGKGVNRVYRMIEPTCIHGLNG